MDVYGIFSMISTICAVLFFLCAVLAVILFFLFQIPRVIGFLSGSTARKSVQKLESRTASSGPLQRNPYSAADYHLPAPGMGLADSAGGGLEGGGESETSLLSAGGADPAGGSGPGAVGETSRLDPGTTSLLSGGGETALLGRQDPVIMTPQMQHELGMGLTATLNTSLSDVTIGTFHIIKEIVSIHTEEVI